MNGFTLYWRYARVNLLAALQYKGWPLVILATVFSVATDPIDSLAMLDRFGAVGSFTPSMIMLVYGLALWSFGLAKLFGCGFDCFANEVRTGSFDRIMLRPRSTFLQVTGLRFHLQRIARVAGGGFIAAICLRAQGVRLTPESIALIIMALAGGVLTYVGVFVLIAALSIFTIQPLDFTNAFTNGSYQVAKVPPKYLPDWLRRMFTYIVPMFAFCYYPAASVCGWGEPRWMGYLALPVGAAFFALTLLVWHWGVRHYRSTGS